MEDVKIAIIIGTRAEFIKTFPVMLELQRRKIDYFFMHTGQHNLKDLCKKFSTKEPDIILTKEPEKTSRFNSKKIKAIVWNVSLIRKIRKEISKLKNLEYVLYHGDTMTTFASAIGTSKFLNPMKKYKNVHLEAGLRSWNNFEPFPEEMTRRVVVRFSDILFAVSPQARNNIKKYQGRKKIHVVGNTILDSADFGYSKARSNKTRLLSKEKFALISVHRHENLKSKERMEKIVEILLAIDIPAFFTIHDNTLKSLEKFGLLSKLKRNKNIKIISSMDYVSFIYQVANCSLIICDGGSIQEESIIFQKACVILRKATERPEGLCSNFQFLSELDVKKTKKKMKEYLSSSFKIDKFENPYGKVGVSEKIVDILTK